MVRIRKSGLSWAVEVEVWSSMLGGTDWMPFAWRPTWAKALDLANWHAEDCYWCQRRRIHQWIPRDA